MTKRRVLIALGAVFGLLLVAAGSGAVKLFSSFDAYPEVWSSNAPSGQTYEFKVNCFHPGYDTLEECSLWDLTAVEVDSPDGGTYALEKDFNVNDYSGEVTRRWVLYGPEGGELPLPGTYVFRYLRDAELIHQQTVDYELEVVGYPTDVDWRWEGDDLHVTWTPGEGMAKGMWYKVLVFPESGGVKSLTFDWDATSAVLPALRLNPNEAASLNVAAYFSGGYAQSEMFDLVPSGGSVWEGRGQEVYPDVWSSSSPQGYTYEFKTNCFGDFEVLEECVLWDVTSVEVLAPDGRTFALEKDFNVNEYSGEVTRRWVLYGPEGGELPLPGTYTFRYLRDDELIHQQTVDYAPEVVGYPTKVDWRWEGDDLHVTWTPGEGMAKGMWYKVLVFPDGGNVLSLTFDWDASDAVLPDLPLTPGQFATLNVAAYFSGGYAPSEYHELDYVGFER